MSSSMQHHSRRISNGLTLLILIVVVVINVPIATTAWIPRTSFQPKLAHYCSKSPPRFAVSSGISTTNTNDDLVLIQQACKSKMLEYSQQTQSGQSSRSAPQSLLDEIESCLQTLEQPPSTTTRHGSSSSSSNNIDQPARSPLVFGKWWVRYTDAPPPSNGQLGIFSGLAYQTVDGTCYTNLLEVPPNQWLSAALQATWEEWDGSLLDKQVSVTASTQNKQLPSPISSSSSSSSKLSSTTTSPVDYGATCWKVTFERLDIKLFGIPVIRQVFPPTTQRIWRTTFVDEDTRIVRAGTTGLPEDEYVFYMTRV